MALYSLREIIDLFFKIRGREREGQENNERK